MIKNAASKWQIYIIFENDLQLKGFFVSQFLKQNVLSSWRRVACHSVNFEFTRWVEIQNLIHDKRLKHDANDF